MSLRKVIFNSNRMGKIGLIILTTSIPLLVELLILDSRFHGKFWSFLLVPILITVTLYPAWKTVLFLGLSFSSLKYIIEFSHLKEWDFNFFLSLVLNSASNWTILLVAASFIIKNMRLSQEISESNKTLKQESSFLTTILDTMNEGVLVANHDGEIVFINKAFARDFNAPTGIEPQEWLKHYPVYHEDETPFKLEETPLYIALTERRTSTAQMWLTSRNNDKKLLYVSGAPIESGGIVLTRDITQQWHHNDLLKQLAYTDPLTGLLNRRAFKEKHEQLIDSNTKHALLFLDCNKFKEINDTYGHEAGDQILKMVSQVMLQSVNRNASVGRLAGDEFTILVPYDDLSEVKEIIKSVRKGCQTPINVDKDIVISYQVSIGVSLFPNDAGTLKELMHRADQAMYQAKQKDTPNPYVFYSKTQLTV